jgi:dihydroxyacid dehydratase/phosphogluconate dehydratase
MNARNLGRTNSPGVSHSNRSSTWPVDGGKNGFIVRRHFCQMGWSGRQSDGRSIILILIGIGIGIGNSWSELTQSNAHRRGLAEGVRRGIHKAGGVAIEFPFLSLGKPFMRRSSKLCRDMASMELEELIRANPSDSVVVLTGCDKPTPAGLMGVASLDLPAVLHTGEPMLNGRFRGRVAGSGSDMWRMPEAFQAGGGGQEEFTEFKSNLNRAPAHCITIGTALSMAYLTEALCVQIPGAAALPAGHSRRMVLAVETGVRAVELSREGLRPSRILTRAALENLKKGNSAFGDSTNVILHLLAIAGRIGAPLTLDDIDRIGCEIQLFVDLMPSVRFLMEEFVCAGGMPAFLAQLPNRLDLDAITVTGSTLRDNHPNARVDDVEAIQPINNSVQLAGSGTAVLRGNLGPDGAIIKISATEPRLLSHEESALVFDSREDCLAVVESPDMDVTADIVLIVRNVGPRGYPGTPEVGHLPLPKTLLHAGIRDVVGISDGRMIGTAYGARGPHVGPEAAIGGPLALVRTGDVIRLDVADRSLDVLVSDDELTSRRGQWRPVVQSKARGWEQLYVDHFLEADRGADYHFLLGPGGDQHAGAAF